MAIDGDSIRCGYREYHLREGIREGGNVYAEVGKWKSRFAQIIRDLWRCDDVAVKLNLSWFGLSHDHEYFL